MPIHRVSKATVVLVSVLFGCTETEPADDPDGELDGATRGGTMRADAGSTLDAARPATCDAAADDAATCTKSVRTVLDGAVVNARDLGGTAIENGARVAYGALYRGPPLSALSTAGCAEFAELGVRTVIDLRVASEREAKPTASCVSAQATVIKAPLPIPYSVSTDDYIADLDATSSVAAAFRALGDEAAYPIYFHCTWGRDRTGVLAALILLALGATHAEILDEYNLSEQTVGAYPESLAGLLDEIEGRGGIASYFEAAAIPATAIATLRARAAAP